VDLRRATGTEPAVIRRAAWTTVAFLWITYVLNYTDRQVVFSIFPVLKSELRFSDAQLGLIGTVFNWVYSLSMPVAGRFSDLARRERVILASVALWSLATVGTGLSRSVGAFLFWRGVVGVTESLYVPAALGVIAVLHPGTTRSRAFSVHGTAQFTGIVLGGWFGGWMAEHTGWRTGFQLLGMAGAAWVVILAAYLHRFPPMKSTPASTPAKPLDIFRSRCYTALFVTFFAFCAMLWVIYAWLPDFLYERFHLSLAQAGLTATLYLQVSCSAGILAGGALADFIVPRHRAARFYVLVGGLLAACPFTWLIFTAQSLALMKLAALGFGTCAGVMIANIFAAAYDVVAERNYGFSNGTLNMAGGLAGGAAILSVGVWKASLGIDGLMAWAAAVTALLGIALAMVVWRWFGRDREQALAETT
jgi:predicted MFS family arabinose efflux permease